MKLEEAKQRFGIIGNSNKLEQAMRIALQVAPTDISVLISGESGTGKEAMPKIIHHNSRRKHQSYIAVNCGAIPEGTIDSELFGHEKGSFTGASEQRKGYFEVANGGTIFLDEVGELPLSTQVRLLRVLETGEYMKVGSSSIQKVDVRVVAATNVNLLDAIKKGKFREDLFYRLNTINIKIPPLRRRKEDINLLIRKFALDFADQYKIPPIRINEECLSLMEEYSWPGNIRQLKNIVEQISAIEQNRNIELSTLSDYIPKEDTSAVLYNNQNNENDFSEREILYKVLFDMKKDLNQLKSITNKLMKGESLEDEKSYVKTANIDLQKPNIDLNLLEENIEKNEQVLTLQQHEKNLISKALKRWQGRRKDAADELGISERTLYRKIKEYNL